MKEISQMRLGVLREIKNIRRFFDVMEHSVKGRNPDAINKSYMFLMNLLYQMEKGCLNPDNIDIDVELAKELYSKPFS
jgi:hypothetical protein